MVCALGAMLAALAGRLVYIYAVSSEPLQRLAYQQHHMRVPIRPCRGSILDARLRPLAGSLETQSVFGDPKLVEDPAAVAGALAPIL
jgi:cell division protein FtsI/penicillin-binding protein 2